MVTDWQWTWLRKLFATVEQFSECTQLAVAVTVHSDRKISLKIHDSASMMTQNLKFRSIQDTISHLRETM